MLKNKLKKVNWKVLILSLITVYLVGFIGNIFTYKSIGSAWYLLIRPAITPPGIVFTLVWNVLFFLIGIALYLALTSSKKNQKKKVVWIFGANLFLNMFWTFLFFGLQKPVLAYFELILFWVSIWVLIFEVYSVNKKASFILIPYLLWVTFAGILNYLSII